MFNVLEPIEDRFLQICAEEGFYFEPFLQLLADFNKFMEAYQAAADMEK
jgi:hypothetical protein